MRIVGYTYRAEHFCPGCIMQALKTGPGEDFDGWTLAPGVAMSTESNLDEIAFAFGINRRDEHTFDSDYFPKVIFSYQLDETEECGTCGTEI